LPRKRRYRWEISLSEKGIILLKPPIKSAAEGVDERRRSFV
jgi:hypothetical protein